MADSDITKNSSSKMRMLLIFVAVFMLGIGFSGLFSAVLDKTNTTEFCTDCHTMKVNLEELKESVHWKSGSGVHASCADCHVPKQLLPKLWAKVMAAKDVYHEIMGTIDTPEKYEARRWEMANIVWKKMKDNDSRECRNCHSFDHMDLSEQARSARKKHDRATDKGDTCIDCHKGIAHTEPDEPDEPEPAEEQEESTKEK